MTLPEAIKKLQENPQVRMAQLPNQIVGFYLKPVFTKDGIVHSALKEAICIETKGKVFVNRTYKNYPISDTGILSDQWEVLELPPL